MGYTLVQLVNMNRTVENLRNSFYNVINVYNSRLRDDTFVILIKLSKLDKI